MKIILLSLFSLLFFVNISKAQKITYATEDIKGNGEGYNILGKINEKYFIHIEYFSPVLPHENINEINRHRNDAATIEKSYIYIYNKQMQLVSKEKLPLPKDCFGLRFINYEDFIYIFYQYTKGNNVLCMAAKIDSNGKINEKPIMLSKVTLNYYYAHPIIYNLIYSENKKEISIFTVQETEDQHILNFLISDQDLKNIQHKKFEIPSRSKYEILSDFNIDNEGNIFFLKKDLIDNPGPYKYVLNFIGYNTEKVFFYDMTPDGIELNNLSFRINNADKKLNFFSFYVELPLNALWNDIPLSKATTKSGIFDAMWDIENKQITGTVAIPFQNILDSNSYTFNNSELMKLPIQNFIVEDIYNTKKGNFVLQGQNADIYNPYRHRLTTNGEYQGITESGYLDYNITDPNEHRADSYSYTRGRISNRDVNLLLLSFDSTGAFKKFNFANEFKVRYFISMITGDAINYFFIHEEKNNYSVNHSSFTSNGEIHVGTPLKTDGNYKFPLTLFYKQVSETELIFPVVYMGKLNFAKIEF